MAVKVKPVVAMAPLSMRSPSMCGGGGASLASPSPGGLSPCGHHHSPCGLSRGGGVVVVGLRFSVMLLVFLLAYAPSASASASASLGIIPEETLGGGAGAGAGAAAGGGSVPLGIPIGHSSGEHIQAREMRGPDSHASYSRGAHDVLMGGGVSSGISAAPTETEEMRDKCVAFLLLQTYASFLRQVLTHPYNSNTHIK